MTFFTIDEVARILRLHPRTVRRRVKAGELRAVDRAPGGSRQARLLVPEAELSRYRNAIGESVTDYIAARRARRCGHSGHAGARIPSESRKLNRVCYELRDGDDAIIVGKIGRDPALRVVVGRHGRTVRVRDRSEAKAIASALLEAAEG